MMKGVLLDTHVLLWLESQSPIRPQAASAIHTAAMRAELFMSDISIWEFGVAIHKKSFERRPNLNGLSVQGWFQKTTKQFGIRQLRISARIAIEAADVPGVYGSGDPGDCFLIASARMRDLSLATRDSKMIALAKRAPAYLDVTLC